MALLAALYTIFKWVFWLWLAGIAVFMLCAKFVDDGLNHTPDRKSVV
jgi:hypothetical protein